MYTQVFKFYTNIEQMKIYAVYVLYHYGVFEWPDSSDSIQISYLDNLQTVKIWIWQICQEF